MKGIQTNYAPETAAAFEAFNSALDSIAVERAAIKAEREAIVSDALANVTKTCALRKRLATSVDRSLDCDRAELVLLENDLPKMERAAKADWKTEAERFAAIEADRVAVLEKHAVELGMNPQQKHRLILEDRTRRDADEARKTAAERASKPNIITEDDAKRIAELKEAIAGVFR